MKKGLIIFAPLLFVLFIILYFYSPFILNSLLPIPGDTIIGLYHPFRDLYSSQYPNGIPYKNFLITDPVRQTYVWKELIMNLWTSGQIPLWNPYEMAGKPLMANFQSGAFYPLNFILLFKPFYISWSVFIVLQSILSAIFMFLYLLNLKLGKKSAAIGALVVSFSGFFVSWLEWGTIGHTALWLPLILLIIDKVFENPKTLKVFIKINQQIIWMVVLSILLLFSFFAGHLQTFFYIYLVSIFYFLMRFIQNKMNLKLLLIFIVSNLIFLILSLPQLLPTLQFISLSSRSIDQDFRNIEGWFMPWQHLFQFLSPDFFGNPATLNYWGTWNYGELIGYIGVLPLILAIYGLFKKNIIAIFFACVGILSLVLVLPTGISSLPFILHIPLISTAQPTRLLFLVAFSLAVISSFGFEYLIHQKKFIFKNLLPVFITGIIIGLLWIGVFAKLNFLFPKFDDIMIAKRNLIFPTILFAVSSVYLFLYQILKQEKIRNSLFIIGILIIAFDLLRFAQKFTPFVVSQFIFPDTKIIQYLKNQKGIFRIANTDRRIMPPNFYTHYKLQTIEGYDPLYLQNYAEFIAMVERNKPDIKPPFGFNRIITPHNIESPLFNLLNVKYVLSFDEIKSQQFTKMMEEGKTKLYLNNESFDRVFFVKNIISNNNPNFLFTENLKEAALVGGLKNEQALSIGNLKVTIYEENIIEIQSSNSGDGFMVLTDVYYPSWHAYIDGKETKIFETDLAFRGILVPKGNHNIIFKDSLF